MIAIADESAAWSLLSAALQGLYERQRELPPDKAMETESQIADIHRELARLEAVITARRCTHINEAAAKLRIALAGAFTQCAPDPLPAPWMLVQSALDDLAASHV